MIQTIKDFESFAYNIGEFIEKSNYKTKYFIESLSLSKPTFYRKMREHSFSVQELGKIAELLFPQEFYEWKINNNKKVSLEQYKEGEFTSAKKAISEVRKKYQNQ